MLSDVVMLLICSCYCTFALRHFAHDIDLRSKSIHRRAIALLVSES